MLTATCHLTNLAEFLQSGDTPMHDRSFKRVVIDLADENGLVRAGVNFIEIIFDGDIETFVVKKNKLLTIDWGGIR